MKKITRLTESDLTRIVRRIIKEEPLQQTSTTGSMGNTPNNMDLGSFIRQFNGRGGNYFYIDKGFSETYITFGIDNKKYKVKV